MLSTSDYPPCLDCASCPATSSTNPLCPECDYKLAKRALLRAEVDDAPALLQPITLEDLDQELQAKKERDAAKPLTPDEQEELRVQQREEALLAQWKNQMKTTLPPAPYLGHTKAALYSRTSHSLVNTFPTVEALVRWSLQSLVHEKTKVLAAAHRETCGRFAAAATPAGLNDDFRHWLRDVKRQAAGFIVTAAIAQGDGLEFPPRSSLAGSGIVSRTAVGTLQNTGAACASFEQFTATLAASLAQTGSMGVAPLLIQLHALAQKLKLFDALLVEAKEYLGARSMAIRKHAHYISIHTSYEDDASTTQAAEEALKFCQHADDQLVQVFSL